MSFKHSDYNILVKHVSENLLFNGLSGALLVVPDELFGMMEQKHDPDSIRQTHPDEFEDLVQTRCLLRSDVDELTFIKQRHRGAVYGDRVYHLTVNPTMNCNFKCWYCYEGHVQSKMSPQTQASLARHIQTLIDDREIKGLRLGWFGGEPMMTFTSVIYPLSKQLKEMCSRADIPFVNSITTNAYLITEKHLPLYEEIGLANYQITLDGNRDRHNRVRFLKKSERPTYDRIIANINTLAESLPGANINLRINFQEETLRHIDEIISDFPEKNRDKIRIDFQRVWQTYEQGGGKPNEQLKYLINYFKAHGFRAHSGSNDFVLMRTKKCYADQWYQAVVNYDGNIFKCTARDFTDENSEGHLSSNGQIEWKKDKIEARFARAPWERERCTECHLLPLCMGPCTQHMLEAGEENRNNHCWLDSLELTVEDYVIGRFESMRKNTAISEIPEPIAV